MTRLMACELSMQAFIATSELWSPISWPRCNSDFWDSILHTSEMFHSFPTRSTNSFLQKFFLLSMLAVLIHHLTWEMWLTLYLFLGMHIHHQMETYWQILSTLSLPFPDFTIRFIRISASWTTDTICRALLWAFSMSKCIRLMYFCNRCCIWWTRWAFQLHFGWHCLLHLYHHKCLLLLPLHHHSLLWQRNFIWLICLVMSLRWSLLMFVPLPVFLSFSL